MTGKGYIVWPSGAKSEGDFSGGYLHGFGTFTGHDGSVYRGNWRMNIRHGLGRKEYPNSDIYDGSWKEGVHEGSGRYSWNSGNIYIGSWKDGKMSGRGVMKWMNGDIYDGSWLNGYRHGSGVYMFADGGHYSGTWSKGLKDGKGKFYPAGSKHPSLRRMCSNLGYDDNTKGLPSQGSSINSEGSETSKPRVKRSLSERISVGGLLRSSGRISHRTSSLDGNWSQRHPSVESISNDFSSKLLHDSDESQSDMPDGSPVVYEREYMQGVLMKETVRNYTEQTRKGKPRNKHSVKEVKKKSCVDIFEGHRSYYLMLNLQLGIRYTVGKITPVPMREVRSSDFGDRARIRMYFPRKGSQFTPPHNSIDFSWKDYCPMVFRNLREMFKLDAAEYMMSICGDDGLRERSSPGKSGSIFYLSHDDRFFIKTLKKTELKVLLRMLHEYYIHVKKHENTLITKFFGLHRITLRGGRKVRFVVMGNMFCTELRIHRSYDLKGSTVGRCTDKDKIKENTTLKDLDLSFEFQMDKLLREYLFKQISIDCEFLESQQIIDYSLLLGLHFRAPEHLKALLELPTTATNSDSACLCFRFKVQLGVNMPAQANHKLLDNECDSNEVELFEVYDVVLYMGIIDILQEYNVKKKIEHAFKSLQFDPQLISAVEPKFYASRFINFLKKKFPQQP
ncbi:phosphatidylinositol 4-phosphate 5-kinase 8 [Citrus sinensis]|nr:phosphatidylinositol 4-phosphate 5-kinase 8 [Citrus sinensis]